VVNYLQKRYLHVQALCLRRLAEPSKPELWNFHAYDLFLSLPSLIPADQQPQNRPKLYPLLSSRELLYGKFLQRRTNDQALQPEMMHFYYGNTKGMPQVRNSRTRKKRKSTPKFASSLPGLLSCRCFQSYVVQGSHEKESPKTGEWQTKTHTHTRAHAHTQSIPIEHQELKP
jgi:hypothetical protein